jgi:opacity protein-like surface antigen
VITDRRYAGLMRALTSAALAATLLAAGAAAAQETPFEPTGEVRLLGYGSVGTGASFDDTRVVGPNVNLTRREDGTWGGDLAGQNVDLHFQGENRLMGPNVNITYSTRDGTTLVEGLFYGRRVRVEMGKKKLQGRLGACSLDLSRRNVQTFFGDVGCSNPQRGLGTAGKATLTLLGVAASANPPLPQLALALFALLPG